MAIIGKAAPRSGDIIERVAHIVGCEPAVIDAIIQTETQADAFDPLNRLVIRPEVHKVASCPLLSAEEKAKAAKLGFTKTPKLVGYHIDATAAGNSAWDWVDRFAGEFGQDAAFWCTSFGSPQIMGFNHRVCKFDSPIKMVEAFAEGEDAQLIAMGNFIIANGLKDACRQRKWATIARIYNGKDYRKNLYDNKLEMAYNLSTHQKSTTFVYPADDVWELGEQGGEVKAIQARLSELGFHVIADGDFGVETRDAVRALQFRLGLAVDGKVGPETRRAMATAPAKEPPATPLVEVVAGSTSARASLAQIGTGVAATVVAAANATSGVPTITDVEGHIKVAEQGIGLAQKILAVGVDKLLIALAVGSLIFGGITLWRRIQAHYQRKIG